MPVFIDIDLPEHHLVASGAGNARALLGTREAGGIVVGLINNMPDFGVDIHRASGIPSAQRGGGKNSGPVALLYSAKGPSD